MALERKGSISSIQMDKQKEQVGVNIGWFVDLIWELKKVPN